MRKSHFSTNNLKETINRMRETANNQTYKLSSKFVLKISLVLILILGLAACGMGESSLLSDVKLDGQALTLDGQGGPKTINLSYTLGKTARVSLMLEGPGNSKYNLRTGEERPTGQYATSINGLVDLEENGQKQRRLLPDGIYRYTLTAEAGSEKTSDQGQFSISGNRTEGPPEISGLSAFPNVISPNFDALDDVTTFNWRTSRPATVTVSVSGPDGFSKTLKTIKNQPAQEDKITFDGRDLKGEPLSDGTYTFTITALDAYGQETRRSGSFQVQGGGKPNVVITSAEIGPEEIITGNEVTVKVRIKNLGKVPVRSQGPDSGFLYSTREVYSSVESGNYDEKAGFWRIGLDFEANTTAGAVRYPWRWGFGKEYLLPGEEVEITGRIKIERGEQKIVLYLGLIQEKIALRADRVKVTQIKVTY
jgi:hypothetical protein